VLQDQIENAKIIAIIRGIDSSSIQKVAEALYQGGIRFLEVTYDHQSKDFKKTSEAISALCKNFAGRLNIGAGTVTSVDLVKAAAENGAQFIISPDCNVEVIRATKRLHLVSIPGAMTPSEILTAYDAGADFVKVFPAGSLGPSYIKAVRGPIPQVKLMAVGGIDASNAASFLEAGCVGLGVGGKLVSKSLVAAGKFDEITKNAQELVAAVQGNV
jgi:2-dehydro-3-deoxyphosphogluconate aldolase/(4S)-4-hydroxy-2-oxoglutarate aldolase